MPLPGGVCSAVRPAQFGTSRVATVLLVLAAFAHTFVFGLETTCASASGVRPRDGCDFELRMAARAFVLYIELTTGERAMGVFILPLLVALQAIPAFSAVIDEPRSLILESRGSACTCRR